MRLTTTLMTLATALVMPVWAADDTQGATVQSDEIPELRDGQAPSESRPPPQPADPSPMMREDLPRTSERPPEEQEDEDRWIDRGYASIWLGWMKSSATRSKLDRRLEDRNINATVTSLDNSDWAYALSLGYELTDSISAELGYMDLGQVEVRYTVEAANEESVLERIETVHPEMGKGLFLAVRYTHSLRRDLDATLGLGLFNWKGEFDTYSDSGTRRQHSLSGTDLMLQAGVAYALHEHWRLTGVIGRVFFANDPSDTISIGVKRDF